MATATAKTVEVEKTVTVKERVYTLELSKDEALALQGLLSSIGGRSEVRKTLTEGSGNVASMLRQVTGRSADLVQGFGHYSIFLPQDVTVGNTVGNDEW